MEYFHRKNTQKNEKNDKFINGVNSAKISQSFCKSNTNTQKRGVIVKK